MITGQHTGSVSLGGPIVTAGGLVFSAASFEPYIRGFDLHTGLVLWRGSIPGPAQATPMTYEVDNRQFIVICSGEPRPVAVLWLTLWSLLRCRNHANLASFHLPIPDAACFAHSQCLVRRLRPLHEPFPFLQS